jgi:hypothetical protein
MDFVLLEEALGSSTCGGRRGGLLAVGGLALVLDADRGEPALIEPVATRASHAYSGLGHESRERRDDENERRPHDEAEHDAGHEHADVVHPVHSSRGSGRKPGPRGPASLARSGGFDCPVGSGRLGVSRSH